jgi:hypothetical protein
MPFVKLDCQLLHSTLWLDIDATRIFLTSLMMAEPREIKEPMAQLDVNTMQPTGWEVPSGWYGFVPAAGPGIVTASLLDMKVGMAALVRLGTPEPESRSPEFDGRRLVRVSGGFVVLNYMHYREKDHTAAIRMRRWREKKKADNGNGKDERHAVTLRNVTQAEAEEDRDTGSRIPTNRGNMKTKDPRSHRAKSARQDVCDFLFEDLWSERPRRDGTDSKSRALRSWNARLKEGALAETMLAAMRRYRAWCEARHRVNTQFVMQTATFLGPDRHFEASWNIDNENGKSKEPWKPGAYE